MQDMQYLLADLRSQVLAHGARLEVIGLGTTGYAGDVLHKLLMADANVVETVAHMVGTVHFFGEVDVICDVGGQDIKVLLLENGDLKDFRLSNHCSAGNGMLLQSMAEQLGVPMAEYAGAAFRARRTPAFRYGCAVFLAGDCVHFQKEGYSR